MLLKRLNMMNWLKTLMLFRLLIIVIQSKKPYRNTKINEIEKKNTDHDHDKYITTQEVKEIMSKSFAARSAQANLASKDDNVALVKKTDFEDKLKNLNKKVTRNKAKHVEA